MTSMTGPRRGLYARRGVVWAIVMMLAGCGATGPKFAPTTDPASDKSLLYVYRPSASVLGARLAVIEIDDVRIASMREGGYVEIRLVPGVHRIRQHWASYMSEEPLFKPISREVSLEPGGKTYVRLQSLKIPAVGRNGLPGFRAEWRLDRVREALALPEISLTNRVDLEPSAADLAK